MDAYTQGLLTRIENEPIETTVERLHQHLDRLSAIARRKEPECLSLGLTGLEESIVFYVEWIDRAIPQRTAPPVIDMATWRGGA
jgi:hypothetical protein